MQRNLKKKDVHLEDLEDDIRKEVLKNERSDDSIY